MIFATANPGKLAELRGLVGGALEVVSAAEFPHPPQVEEDQESFEGNAEKKARAYAEASGLPALADDSGLCVDALGGRPGVHSARYGSDDAGRIRRLLEELREVPEDARTARFRCALCLAVPGGEVVVEVGECEGRILGRPRGAGGFGYDPVFWVPSLGRTFAELSPHEKSAISHRGQAFRRMLPHLLALAGR